MNKISAIEELLEIVTHISNFKELSKRIGYISKSVKEEWANKCAICGKKKWPLRAAHIVPAEEGGKHTCTNLIPLCERDFRNLAVAKGKINEVGCHDLFDKEGSWSRQKIRCLKNAGPKGNVKLMRPVYKKCTSSFEAKKRDIEHLIAMRSVKNACDEINKLLINESSFQKIFELLIIGLRCARRRRGKIRKKEIINMNKKLGDLYQEIEARKLTTNMLEKIEYEKAMIAFAEKNFKGASELFRRYKLRKLM
jgi:hypothetical protein